MFESPPKEKKWLLWLYVLIWVSIIFMTIPLARSIQDIVYKQWGREIFSYIVLACVTAGFIASIFYLLSWQKISRTNYLWLLSVTAVFFIYTIDLAKESPEESIHFIQYGVLGFLLYRFLSVYLQDISIYFTSAILSGIIGIIDEFFQWLTPGRIWSLRDIWLNFLGAALVQIAIAKGLKPRFIVSKPARLNLSLLCRLLLFSIILLGLTFINTPPRILWYSDKIPWLAFLKNNDTVMLEYGYLYEDPQIGLFRSRFSRKELKELDKKRAIEVANILNRFKNVSLYRKFLENYTPITDPFTHEARVHLYRRDFYVMKATKYKVNQREYEENITIAYRENQIMEKYFPTTLRHSLYTWPKDKTDVAKDYILRDKLYESEVSKNLVTQIKEKELIFLFAIIVIVLAVIDKFLSYKKIFPISCIRK